MSECVRASMIFPLILRQWSLTRFHIIREYYKSIITIDKLKEANVAKYIIWTFDLIAKFNCFISNINISKQDKETFEIQVIDARKIFASLMNCFKASRKKSQKFKKLKTFKKRRRRSNVDFATSTKVSEENQNQVDLNEATQIDSSIVAMFEDKMIALSNVHATLHFKTMMKKYDASWNINALASERMHK